MTEYGKWFCVCFFADGTGEVTEWITRDGADQMASETEQEWLSGGKRAACVVVPNDGPDAVTDAAAVAQILLDQPDNEA